MRDSSVLTGAFFRRCSVKNASRERPGPAWTTVSHCVMYKPQFMQTYRRHVALPLCSSH